MRGAYLERLVIKLKLKLRQMPEKAIFSLEVGNIFSALTDNEELSMWLSRDKCTRHTIYRMLVNVHVNSMAAPRKLLRKDVKEVVVTLYLSGLKQGEISRRLQVPSSTLTFMIDRFRKRGSVENIQGKESSQNWTSEVLGNV